MTTAPSSSRRRSRPAACGGEPLNAPPPTRGGGEASASAAAPPPPPPPKKRRRSSQAAAPLEPSTSDFVDLAISIADDAPAGRALRIRPHEGGSADQATALVVTRLSFTWRPAAVVLRALMSKFGSVAGVAVDEGGGDSAVVLFEDAAGVAAALAAARAGKVARLKAGDLPPVDAPIGLKAWVERHKAAFLGVDRLREEVDGWMAAFDAEEARKTAAAAAAAAAATDDDGWTVVVRGGGRKKTSGGGISVGAVAPAAAAARAAAKGAPKVDTDFYRFQKRDARRHELAELRLKFEEDKRRIAELRASRRFRPG